MAWIESHTALDKHPKLLMLKTGMRWSKSEAVGFLHRFWWTVLEYAPSGAFVIADESADAVISALPLEVMVETLGMESDVITKAIDAMCRVRLLDRNGETYICHDWLDYAGSYLKDTKYRRKPERFAAIETFYRHVARLSADNPPTVARLSAVPNLPDLTLPNQPTNHGVDDSGTEDTPSKVLSRCSQFLCMANVSPADRAAIPAIVEVAGGVDMAVEWIRTAAGTRDGKNRPVRRPILYAAARAEKEQADKAMKSGPKMIIETKMEHVDE